MKNRNGFIFVLITFVCACFMSCNNAVMEKWWPEQEAAAVVVVNNDDVPPPHAPAPGDDAGGYFTVHFDPNIESILIAADRAQPDNLPEEQLVAKNSKIIEPPGGTIPGYGFAGWYMQPDCKNLWNFNSALTEAYTAENVMTLYAKWEANPITVRFEPNGGSARPRDQIVANGSNALIEPAAGTRPGYGFAGWYVDMSFSRLWNFDDPITGDMTLCAKWELPHCTVSFDANGGAPIPEAQDLANGQTVREPASMTRVGCGFGGWYDNEDCAGDPWNFATPVTATAVTLYAKWVANLYTVSFAANGGSPAPAAQTVSHGNHVERPAIMTQTAMGFGGWYKDSDCSEGQEWDFLTDTVTSSITLYAKWGPAVYTIIFVDSVDGSSITSQTLGYQDKVIRPPDPTKSAYAFKGWYTSTNTDDRSLFDFDTEITDDSPLLTNNTITLYARWVKHNPVIVYVPGGSFSMGVPSGSGSAGERKAHTVTVSGFYIYPYETTQRQIDLITWWKKWKGRVTGIDTYNFWSTDPNAHGFNPSAAKGEYRPVESVTWYDAVYLCNLATEYENSVTRQGITKFEPAYIITKIKHADGTDGVTSTDDFGNENWIAGYAILDKDGNNNDITRTNRSIVSATVKLNPKLIPGADYNPEVVGYRLPTEAEWEYAARGGDGSPGDFLWAGSNNANDVAWYLDNTTQTQTSKGKAPNGLGLYDMSGNVCEWLWDKYENDYYGKSIGATDPLGPTGADGAPPMPLGTLAEERTRRGGSIRHGAEKCKTQVRDSWPANKEDNWNIGFRIVRSGEE